jgi:hypothetical protein
VGGTGEYNVSLMFLTSISTCFIKLNVYVKLKHKRYMCKTTEQSSPWICNKLVIVNISSGNAHFDFVLLPDYNFVISLSFIICLKWAHISFIFKKLFLKCCIRAGDVGYWKTYLPSMSKAQNIKLNFKITYYVIIGYLYTREVS